MFKNKEKEWELSVTASQALLKMFKVFRAKNTNFPTEFANLDTFNVAVVDPVFYSLISYLYRLRKLSKKDALQFQKEYPFAAHEYDKRCLVNMRLWGKQQAYDALIKKEDAGFTVLGKYWKQFFM